MPASWSLRALVSAATLALASMLAACDAGARSGKIVVGDAWVRETSPAVPVSAGYARIENGSGRNARLIGAASPRAGRIELHAVETQNGVARMRELTDGLPLPEGETVELRPGGLHMMFLDLPRPIRPGEQIPATLRFDAALEQTVTFTARSATHDAGGHHE